MACPRPGAQARSMRVDMGPAVGSAAKGDKPGAGLFDHLVGECYKIFRQLDACRFRGLEVDDELVARRLLERQIRRPSAGEDPRGQVGGAFHAFLQVGSV